MVSPQLPHPATQPGLGDEGDASAHGGDGSGNSPRVTMVPTAVGRVEGEVQNRDLMDPELQCWIDLRQLTVADLTLRPRTLARKYIEQKKFADLLTEGLRVAAERSQLVDPNSMADSCTLAYLMPTLLFFRHRRGEESELKGTPWLTTVRDRVTRLRAGEFQGLIDEALRPAREEAIGRNGAPEAPPAVKRKRIVVRGVDLALRGQPSKSLNAMATKGLLDMSDEVVRNTFAKLQDPHSAEGRQQDTPIKGWKPFVDEDGSAYGLPPSSSEFYRFKLGVTTITGTDGTSREVNTLEHVLRGLDSTSAAGLSAMEFASVRHVEPEVLTVLLEPFFGHGEWNPEDAYHQRIHDLLVSNRGIPLDKKGNRDPKDLRPIGVGYVLRRVAAKCMILQMGSEFGAALAARGQFGCGIANGTELIYSLTSRALEALHALGIPCGHGEADAMNAFCSIFRSQIQRGLARLDPRMLPVFDFLYGPHAHGRAYLYAGGARPRGSCALPSGVHQGDVFGPYFFSIGIDQLLADVREGMRNLPVDATMVGRVVKVAESAEVIREASGGVYERNPNDKFRLRVAPTYLELEAPGAVTAGRTVSLELLPGGNEPPEGVDLGSFTAEWANVRLEANPNMMAYLDDISLADDIVLQRPFSKLLRELGPNYGLYFTNRAKNFIYVLRSFSEEARQMFPDAVFVDDDSPGDSPGGQLKTAVEDNDLVNSVNSSRLLITTCGLESLMGTPYRFLEHGGGDDARTSAAWVENRLASQVVKTARLFAHLGDDNVNELAASIGFDGIDRDVPCYPKSEAQCRNLVARYCLGRRHNHSVRMLPPAITNGHIQKIDALLCGVMAGIMKTPMDALSPAQQRRIVLPARWGGSMPGAAVTSEAQFLNATVAARERVRSVAMGLEEAGRPIPPALNAILEREAAVAEGRAGVVATTMESAVAASLNAFNEARANPGAVHRDLANSRGGVPAENMMGEAEGEPGSGQTRAVGGAVVDGEGDVAGDPGRFQDVPSPGRPSVAEVAGVAPGADGDEGVPALTLEELEVKKMSARAMSEPFLKREFAAVSEMSTQQGARSMNAACLKSAGSFLAAIPSVPAFRVGEFALATAARRFNGVSPVPTPHTHHCGNRGQQRLSSENATHMYNCSCLGGNIAPHDAVVDTLAHAVHNCGLTAALPKAEVLVETNPGETWRADLKFVVDRTGEVVTVDVSVVNTDSSSSGRRRGGAGDVEAALREREAEKWALPAAQRILNEEGSNTSFVPFVMSSSGGFGPAARDFLKKLYKTARTEGRWVMAAGQREVQSTWNTLFASTYWDMRLSMACTITSAEVVGRLIVRDENLNMVVDRERRQPHPNPNVVPYGRWIWSGPATERGAA